MELEERIYNPETFDPPLFLKILRKQHGAACHGCRSQNQGIPKGKAVNSMEIDRRENIRDIHGGHVKLRDQFHFATGTLRVDSEFASSYDKIFLQDLKRNHAGSFPPMLSEKIERETLFDWVRIVVDIEEHVCVEEATTAHEFRHG